MYALLIAALIAQDPTRPAPRPSDRDAAAGRPTVEGTWTVIAFERNGSPVDGAPSRTATVRGNMLSFSAGKSETTKETSPDGTFSALRLEFGPRGAIRVTELAGGAAATDPKADRPASDATAPGASEARGGVYVLSRDYLVISVQENRGGTGVGAGRPAVGPAPERKTATDPAAVGPEMRSYLTLILKRSDAGEKGPPPDRK
jgi:hypothetical protein